MLKYLKKCSLLLLTVFLSTCILPAAASAEENLKTTLTLEEIQELAVKNSRSMKENELHVDSADRQKRIATKEKRRLQYGTSMGISEQLRVLQVRKNELSQVLPENPANPNDPGYLIAQGQLMGIESQIAAISSQRPSVSSGIKQYSKLEDQAEDALEDLERMQVDHEEEMQLIAALLAFNALNLKDAIDNLEKTYDFNMRLTDIARTKKEIGSAIDTEIEQQAVLTGDLGKTLRFTREQRELLIHKLNDLMGRDINTPLEIVEFKVPESIIPAPSYESVIDEILENTYDLYKIDREIDRLEDDYDETDGSNEEQIVRNQIELKKLEKEAKLVEVQDNLKNVLANYESKAKAYQLAILDFRRAEKDYNWNKKKHEVGLLSDIAFQGSQLEYQQALNKKNSSGYDYHLARQELLFLKQGISMPYYQAMKARG